jgi:hypothetical protein
MVAEVWLLRYGHCGMVVAVWMLGMVVIVEDSYCLLFYLFV